MSFVQMWITRFGAPKAVLAVRLGVDPEGMPVYQVDTEEKTRTLSVDIFATELAARTAAEAWLLRMADLEDGRDVSVGGHLVHRIEALEQECDELNDAFLLRQTERDYARELVVQLVTQCRQLGIIPPGIRKLIDSCKTTDWYPELQHALWQKQHGRLAP